MPLSKFQFSGLNQLVSAPPPASQMKVGGAAATSVTFVALFCAVNGPATEAKVPLREPPLMKS